MSIVGQNSLLNQFVPTFYISDIQNGQGLAYDSVRQAFTNTLLSTGSPMVSDVLPPDGSSTGTFAIGNNQQYIITGTLEITGHVINNGRIAVL